jgi:hypothetical protein
MAILPQYMSCYLRKEHATVTAEVMPTHGTVLCLATEAEGIGHKSSRSYFTYIQLFLDLHNTKTHCYEITAFQPVTHSALQHQGTSRKYRSTNYITIIV